MSDVPPAIRAAYDPERFRAEGHRLIDGLADALARWQRREGKAIPWRDPHEARAAWAPEPLEGGELVADLLRIADASTTLAHPHTMGHQVPPPLPGAALAELVSALINNGTGVAEMGTASTYIELAVIDWMCATLGYPSDASGVLTSGGSLGNLTALLAMRQAKAGRDAWRQGTEPELAVIVGADAHYSIDRAVRVMGWGAGGAIEAELDAAHRMTAGSVERALARATGRRVIGIVASAGSTATGAFDPLGELADLAAAKGLWLHVDAAHGGGAALSRTHRAKLVGIERADSVVWDAHKLLVMPALVTAVLFRRGGHAFEAFAQQASYLFAGAQPADTWWDLGQRTLECTKRAMAIELWTAVRAHGAAWFGEVVDRLANLAHELARLITDAPDFTLAVEPALDIVCFQHVPRLGMTLEERDAHNRRLRERVVADGRFYIVGTRLPSGYHLRTALMNPLTETRDLRALLDHLRALAVS